ncbi:type II toxin-antitoxin system HicB family antitoxin [Microvirga sp. M2]|uniref:type II toxin-antitoxin system HicB family antitoxin n=1 Tax=Microvirga sp. M2 TaxID=3073270 RepID=UPI0039C3129F
MTLRDAPFRARPPKVARVTITIPENALQKIDNYAESHGYSRAGFLTLAAKKVMAEAV